jgi:hypothetical protein
MKAAGRFLRWWRLPLWLFALATGSKSFVDNPILGSRRLNRAGLHVLRIRVAHAMARWRRGRIAKLVPKDLRDQFDRNGFITIRDVLGPSDFEQIRDALLQLELESREHQQGDTITSRVPVGPHLLRTVPQLADLLTSPQWRGVMAYVASTRSKPLYYLQAVAGGVADGPPDPQIQLHSDAFQPSMKAWLFLSDVGDDDRPLTYVAGSHRLTRARRAWEQRMSTQVLSGGDRLSQRGSFRVRAEDLADLGLPSPTRFCVPANTLVIADTCGFHARADSHRPSLRIELWAYCRRSPFLPWTGGGLLSFRPIAARRMQWLASILDGLDRQGWAKQHWRKVRPRRLGDLLNTPNPLSDPIVLDSLAAKAA